MATQKSTVNTILATLSSSRQFSASPLFGEYALYADGKVVALICDDTLFVKDLPASAALAGICELAPPYEDAKPYYKVTQAQLGLLEQLPGILMDVANTLPAQKKSKKVRVGSAGKSRR